MTASTPRQRRSDGAQTYAAILGTAVDLASVEGLGRLTIGRLAQEVGVSKSGLYAHFGSKQRLELDVLRAAREIFEREVVAPAMAAPEGLARLETLCAAYLSYIERRVFPGGCFFAGLLAEFDAQDGILNDEVGQDQRDWTALMETLITDAAATGDLREDVNADQLGFELTAAIQLANYYFVLFGDAAVLARARASISAAVDRCRPRPARGSGIAGTA